MIKKTSVNSRNEHLATLLNCSPYMIEQYFKKGYLTDLITDEIINQFKEKYFKWYSCLKCGTQFMWFQPKEAKKCPSCGTSKIKIGIHDFVKMLSIGKAALFLGLSYQTVVRLINDEYITLVDGKLLFKELEAFKASYRTFRCINCEKEWTRVRLGFPSSCGKCGSHKIMQLSGPTGVCTFSEKEWSRL